MLKVSKVLVSGNDYSKKSVAELQYIQKDASEAAKAMQDHDPRAESKYLDQVNDASSELYKRQHGKRASSSCTGCGKPVSREDFGYEKSLCDSCEAKRTSQRDANRQEHTTSDDLSF